MKLKFSTSTMMIIGVVGLLVYLISTKAITTQTLYIFGLLLMVLVLISRTEKKLIDYWEARDKAKETIERLQKKREIEQGDIYLMSKTMLQNILYKESESYVIDPYAWDIGVLVHGSHTVGYVCRISIYGNILGTYEIEIPSEYATKPIKEFMEILAKPEHLEKMKEGKTTGGEKPSQ